ncbi:MAG: hypothetical protein ACI4QA_03895 [Candidatus Spyradosoma sp.]
MKPIIILVRGVADSGKTTILRKFYEKSGKSLPKGLKEIKGEIVTIDGIVFGIRTKGDPGSEKETVEVLEEFIADGRVQIILCASRTSGGTVETVHRFYYDGKVDFVHLLEPFEREEKANWCKAKLKKLEKLVERVRELHNL